MNSRSAALSSSPDTPVMNARVLMGPISPLAARGSRKRPLIPLDDALPAGGFEAAAELRGFIGRTERTDHGPVVDALVAEVGALDHRRARSQHRRELALQGRTRPVRRPHSAARRPAPGSRRSPPPLLGADWAGLVAATRARAAASRGWLSVLLRASDIGPLALGALAAPMAALSRSRRVVAWLAAVAAGFAGLGGADADRRRGAIRLIAREPKTS